MSTFFHYIGPGLIPHLLSGFTTVIFYLAGQKPPEVQWRNREKRGEKEHHEKVSFFSSS